MIINSTTLPSFVLNEKIVKYQIHENKVTKKPIEKKETKK
jgi:hypothetical protein